MKRLFGLGLSASIGLFIVDTMGFLDTITGSAMGCGKHWPLCNGQVIPNSWSRATVIEYSHRLIALTGIILLVLFAVMAWRKYRKWKEVRTLIFITVLSVFAEAGLGASSVLVENPTWVLAFHMGIAFSSFTSCVLLTVIIYQIERQYKLKAPKKLRGIMLPGFAKLTWFTMIYLFGAIYYGAFVSHSGYGALFSGWPIPTETLTEAGVGLLIDFGHRLVAIGLFVLVLSLFRRAYRMRWARRDLFIGSTLVLTLTVVQIFSGAYLIFSNMSIPAFMLHVSFASLLFVSVAYLSMQTLPEARAEVLNTSVNRSGESESETDFVHKHHHL